VGLLSSRNGLVKRQKAGFSPENKKAISRLACPGGQVERPTRGTTKIQVHLCLQLYPKTTAGNVEVQVVLRLRSLFISFDWGQISLQPFTKAK
jgi:hypothetical protein